MRWLVTGAQGFIGRYLVADVHDADGAAEVVGLGRSPARSEFTHTVRRGNDAVRAPLPAELAATRPRYRYYSCDIGARDDLTALLREVRPDRIVHLASGLRDDDPGKLFRTNVEGTIALLAAIEGAELDCRVVLGSSGAIYGPHDDADLPLDEDAHTDPRDLYSVSKLASEQVARILGRRSGRSLMWARIFNPVGAGQDERHVCGRLAAQLAAIRWGGAPATLALGDREPTRDFVDVRDVATGLRLLADRGAPGQAYNVGSGRETSVGEVVDGLVRASELDPAPAIERTYHRPADIPRLCGRIARLRALGYAPRYRLEDSLQWLFDYYGTEIWGD